MTIILKVTTVVIMVLVMLEEEIEVKRPSWGFRGAAALVGTAEVGGGGGGIGTQRGAFSLVAVVRWSRSKGELSETRVAAHYLGFVPSLLSRRRNQFPPFPSLPVLLAFLAVLMRLVGHYVGRTTHHAGVVTSLALDGTFLE
ncbi:hypothetical protein Tsubulata_017858 [Turnera subulata]|uniref:Secreted protein n=1 Tax=Turnera subulata TaxID=218843 RepID=A0A9Q0GJ44_9ROSI|nr:hypothetical protein Tsubulata_017858 [Turnera subulata]